MALSCKDCLKSVRRRCNVDGRFGIGLDRIDNGNGILVVLCKLLSPLLVSEKRSQASEDGRIVVHVGLEEDHGNSCVGRDLVQVVCHILHGSLDVAYVDYDFGIGQNQGLLVQVGLLAVESSEGRKIMGIGRINRKFVAAELGCKTHEFLGSNLEHDYLGIGSGRGNAGDVCRKLHFTSEVVHEDLST